VMFPGGFEATKVASFERLIHNGRVDYATTLSELLPHLCG